MQVAAHAVRIVFAEFDHSAVGRAATALANGITKTYFSSARDLAEEERELANKYRRDGRRSELDIERLTEIEQERAAVKKALDETKARQAEAELTSAQEQLISVPLTDDDMSASSGLLASKRCSACGGTMRIRQGGYNTKSRNFWWQRTSQNRFRCPTVKIDLAAEKSTVLRRPDADLDGPSDERRKVWVRPDVLAKTHGRLRASLGDDEEEMICPNHVLPMKLMPKNAASGRMLDSYEYVCLGVMADGLACPHKVQIETFAQVGSPQAQRWSCNS